MYFQYIGVGPSRLYVMCSFVVLKTHTFIHMNIHLILLQLPFMASYIFVVFLIGFYRSVPIMNQKMRETSCLTNFLIHVKLCFDACFPDIGLSGYCWYLGNRRGWRCGTSGEVAFSTRICWSQKKKGTLFHTWGGAKDFRIARVNPQHG